MFIPILKHLDDSIHLPPDVRNIIMLDIGALEHAVPAVIGVARNHIELGLAFVQNKLGLLCVWRCLSWDAFFRAE